METSTINTFTTLFPSYAQLAKLETFSTNESIENFIKNQLPLKVQIVRKLQSTFNSFLNQYTNLIIKRPQVGNLSYSLASRATQMIDKTMKQCQIKCQRLNKQNINSEFYDLHPRRATQAFRERLTNIEEVIRQKYINNPYLSRQKQEQVSMSIFLLLEMLHFSKSDLVTVASKYQLDDGRICSKAFKNQEVQISDILQYLFLEQSFLDYITNIVNKRCRPFYGKKDFISNKIKDLIRQTDSKLEPNMVIFIQSLISKEKHRMIKGVIPQVQGILRNIGQLQEEAKCKGIVEQVESMKRKFMNVKNNSYYIEIIRGNFSDKYKLQLNKLENLYYLNNLEKYLQDVMQFIEQLLRLEEDIIDNRRAFKRSLSNRVQDQLYNITKPSQNSSPNRLQYMIQSQFQKLADLLDEIDVKAVQYSDNPENRFQSKMTEQAQKMQQMKRDREQQQKRMEADRKRKAEQEREQRMAKQQQRKRLEQFKRAKDKQQQQKRKAKMMQEKQERQKREQQRRQKEQQEKRRKNEDMAKRQKQLEQKRKQDEEKKKLEQKERKAFDEKRKKEEEERRKKEEQQKKKRDEQKRKKEQEDRKRREQQKVKKEEEDRRRREEEAQKRKQADEKKRREQQQKKKRDDEQRRRRQQQQRMKREVEQRRKKEEDDRKKKQLEEKKKKDDEQRKKREEEEKRRKEEQEKRKREAEDKRKRQEEQRKRKDEEERIKREADEKKRKQEERIKKEAQEKKKREDEQKKRREQDQRRKKQEDLRKQKEAEDKRKKQEQQRRRKQQEDRKRKQQEEERRRKEDEQKKRKELQEKKRKEDEDRKRKEDEDRKKKELEEKKKREQQQRIRKEAQQKKKRQEEDRKRKQAQDKKKREEQEAKNKKNANQKKSSGFNYGQYDDELIDEDEDIRKPSNIGKDKPGNNDQYQQEYDDDFDQFSPDKEQQEHGEEQVAINQKPLIENENLKCLNEYMKGIPYSRKNKPNLEPFNNKNQYIYVFQQLVQTRKIFIFSDPSIAKIIEDFSNQLADENYPHDQLKYTLETIHQALAQQHEKIHGTSDIDPRTRFIFPFSYNNQLNIYLFEIMPAEGSIRIVFKEQVSEQQEYQVKINNLIDAFCQLYGIEDEPNLQNMVVPPESKAVLDTFDKELPNLLVIFVLHYQIQNEGNIIVNQYTIERFFYVSQVLQPLYAAINDEFDSLQEFYNKLSTKYSQDSKFKICSFQTDLNDPNYQDNLRQMSAKLKSQFLKDKSTSNYLVMMQLHNPAEDEEADFRKIVMYFSLTKQPNGKPLLNYYVVSSDESDEQLQGNMFQWLSNDIDDQFETTAYTDFTRHNGLTQYSEWTLGLWAHICQKRKMSAIQAFRAITLSMAPYYIAYKQSD